MLIQTAGYMWSRWHVDWTQRKLVGTPEEGKGKEVDFAYQSGIYGLFNANQECVYVGQVGKGDRRLYDRLKDHAIEDELFCLWERFTWFGVYSPSQLMRKEFPDRIAEAVTLSETLNTIETICIYLALPRFNRHWEMGFSGVIWYYQAAEYGELKRSKRPPLRSR